MNVTHQDCNIEISPNPQEFPNDILKLFAEIPHQNEGTQYWVILMSDDAGVVEAVLWPLGKTLSSTHAIWIAMIQQASTLAVIAYHEETPLMPSVPEAKAWYYFQNVCDFHQMKARDFLIIGNEPSDGYYSFHASLN